MAQRRNGFMMLVIMLLALCTVLYPAAVPAEGDTAENAEGAVRFDLLLDSYEPEKDHYNFYFTYKTVHAWWDAVAMGMEEAQRQYLMKGVTITYDYVAPDAASAEDQQIRLREAAAGDYDVIGVDVADESLISPVLDELAEAGIRVMTFSSSDAASGCRRIAYVGNTHNYEDGAQLAQALYEKIGGKGKVAMLVGTHGAPCHEDRAKGVQDMTARYPGIEMVAVEYDQDSIDLAYDLTMEILNQNPDLSGLICCNMSNPVGAARAVKETGRNVVIVGMDHDREALRYLREGTIYCLGIQDCYSIGFDTIRVAVKVADGILPGDLYPEKTEEQTTIIYQQDAQQMLELLYGEI
jgi:ribose transport system substrate-binding protein